MGWKTHGQFGLNKGLVLGVIDHILVPASRALFEGKHGHTKFIRDVDVRLRR